MYYSYTSYAEIVLDSTPYAEGWVEDENGFAISYPIVIFTDAYGNDYYATTYSNGTFEIDNLPYCGDYDLYVEEPGGCAAFYIAPVYYSYTSYINPLVVDTVPDVTGRIVDENGFAIPNPMVIFIDPDTWVEYPANTYPDGTFAVTLPYCGEYYILIGGEGCEQYYIATVPGSGSFGDITFNTQPTVTGRVVDQDYVDFSTGIVEFISCTDPGIVFSGDIVNGDFTVDLGACDEYEIFITVPCGTFQLLTGDWETCFDIISDGNFSLIVIQCPPDAPTGLIAEPGPLSEEITLSWNPNPEPNIDGYIIYRGTVSGIYTDIFFYEYTSVTFPGLEIGQTYYFAVSAVDLNGGESELSDEASATAQLMGDYDPPTAPSNLTITDPGTGDQLDLSWLASTDDVAVSHYLIYRLTENPGVSDENYDWDWGFPQEREGTNFTDYEVWEGDTYYYVVYAVDTSGNISGPSNVESDEPTDSIAPDPPTGLYASPGDTVIGLSWAAPVFNDDVDNSLLTDLLGYNIYRGEVSGEYDPIPINWPDLVTTTSYNDSGLTNGLTYYYVVTAVDDSGNESLFSNEDWATPVTANPPPPSPTIINFIEKPASIEIDWDCPYVSDLAGYNIYRKINGSYNFSDPLYFTTEKYFEDTSPHPVLENCYVVRSEDTIGQESVNGAETEECGYVGDGVLWIISPTELDPAIISFGGPAPSVNIIYYLFGDYLGLYGGGVKIKLEIFKTGGSSVYTEWDDNPRGSVDGYNPIIDWNGKYKSGLPVEEGFYDVEVSLYYNGAEILWDRQNEAIIVAEILLTHIKFDHAPGSVSDGTNIRKNFLTDISVPEWVTGGQNEAAAYIINTTKTIQARFIVQPSSIQSAKIRAVSIDNTGSLDDVQERTVNFTNGISDPEYIEFNILGEGQKSVQKTTTDRWQWRVSDLNGGNSPEVNINISGPHIIYEVFAEPEAPMEEPWTEVLDYACTWAKDKKTPSSVVESLVTSINSDSTLIYDGMQHYTSGYVDFNLTQLLNDIKTAKESDETIQVEVDCRDGANWFHVLSSSLGIFAQYKVIDRTTDPYFFIYNWILPLGKDWTTGAWNFHQIGWWNSMVADPVLKLDNDDDPTTSPHIPKLVVGDVTQSQYIDKLTETPDVTDIETGICIPK